ncbi:MAG: L,D-transpeptidase [Patescibacteria group bacterium]|nr:L,D-transpeptidase [Patescibacteria group bacterium]
MTIKLTYLIFTLFLLSIPTAVFANEENFEFKTSTNKILKLPFDTIHSITPIDLGGDGTSELLLGSPPGFIGEVYLIRLDGSIINSWLAYNENFRGGVNVAAGDLDEDAKPEIVTAPSSRGGPHIRIFDGYGNAKISQGFFAAEASYKDGVSIDIKRINDNEPPSITTITNTSPNATFSAWKANGDIIKSYPLAQYELPRGSEPISIHIQESNNINTTSIPRKTKSLDRDGKVIMIDLSSQEFSYYEDGFRLATHITSTGKLGYKTPIGEYEINNKAELAYSNRYGLYMPYWMSFIGSLYGIHELPYWPSRYREGENHLGTAVSHGCVRLGIGSAEEVFEWAEVGTTVIVQE